MTKRLDIAMIMDGNRRWAKKRLLPATQGHKFGAKKLEEVLSWCQEKDICSLTVYTFSTENFNRSEEEKKVIFALFEEYFQKLKKQIESKKIKNLKIKFLGELSLFPKLIQKECEELEALTKDESKYLLQFCFGYGGRLEITSAVKSIVSEGIPVKEITEEIVAKHLYSNIEPDIVIRTSGERRVSNFLPWQTAYSEFFFLETFWPDFSKAEFEHILDEFNNRQRRKGK